MRKALLGNVCALAACASPMTTIAALTKSNGVAINRQDVMTMAASPLAA
jgi:hypothetical protein